MVKGFTVDLVEVVLYVQGSVREDSTEKLDTANPDKIIYYHIGTDTYCGNHLSYRSGCY